ncbi:MULTISPECIES: uracil-DNA glycosylase [Jonquetella]|uniref:Type-4 uracil-DNA glycosylase n=1 Tax=Jonquetella anthropi DSM 22815 TaxID=885272 RepID=H0UK71_9BACT|nr:MULTISPECIES: uracil-DNA glycosylase [Jonquetella]EEX48461.1 uracil-DNA glycosylase A [Jonquetella anthropi E3_33 E1]EHM13080.1 uracil-DNA glycosylase, family 4 [Jonquetella anthropi DSM 22815]
MATPEQAGSVLSLERRMDLLRQLNQEVGGCSRCGLCETRHSTVPGEGSGENGLMIVGEGPGADEDEQGRPFVGRAGQLLSQILQAAGIDRSRSWITNVVKCRPPKNRTPQIEEVLACQDWLEAQLILLQPKVIVSMGNTPTKWFLHSSMGITKLRGQWFSWRGVDLMPMFHPSYLLREDSRSVGSPKYLTWQDIQNVKKRLDEVGGGS